MKWSLFCFSIFWFGVVFSQTEGVWLRPNRGQWDERVLEKVSLQSGEFLLEKNGFTYLFWNRPNHQHELTNVKNINSVDDSSKENTKFHSIRSTFIGSQNPTVLEDGESQHYRNYYLGNDQQKWASKVYDVQATYLKNMYKGVDLKMETIDGHLKYTWFLTNATDLSNIQWKYEGQTNIEKKEGELILTHSFGTIYEGKPVAWIFRGGKKRLIPIDYVEKENGIWHFETTFDLIESDSLVIDPSLVFSTFTGSLSDNWGFTATGDLLGNLYAGGIVFGTGYPTTTGAFDELYNGFSGVDVGISKFSPNGSQLLYSTYLGSTDSETPNSIYCDTDGDLYVMGITGSAGFPMAGTPFDNSFNGGPGLFIDNISFASSDLYVARFNANGTALVASTFIGGSSTDGTSDSGSGTNINFNYGDSFRGDIQVTSSHVFIASTTASTNFPIFGGAQAVLNGAQDAVVIKLPKTLSSIVYSSYYGGTGYETGNGLAVNGNEIYLTGGTTSSNLNLGGGGFQNSNGGATDGYLCRFNNTTGAILNGTYIATTEYDQSYFVQTDYDNDVYIFAQSRGSFPITPGCYGQANSGQVIAKFNPSLTARTWVTSIGNSSNNEELSPTAFLVSNCKEIYLSGWGGDVNSNNSLAVFSTSNGMPVTSDAFQATTNGNNFWIGILKENATGLKYGTFMGGTASSFNHVDGGTSRFDKNGNIYHAVCGACGGNNFGFTTTPGVWSPQNLSANCNLAAFKFELATIQAVVGDPDPLICYPDPVVFTNNSSNGNAFLWNFGDGTTSTVENPSHLYPGPGDYTVSLIVIDTIGCYAPDTVFFEINIGAFEGGVINPNVNTCPNVPVEIVAYGGTNYLWSPSQFLNNPSVSNPIATVSQNTTFQCIISDSCGTDTVFVNVLVFGANVEITEDTSICIGNNVALEITGVTSAIWSPATFLDNPTSLSPISSPSNSITYTVSGTTIEGCLITGVVSITVFLTPPSPLIADTLKYCNGGSGQISVSGAATYEWSPNAFISPNTGATVTISSPNEQYYYCEFVNACASITDSVYISLVTPVINAGNDTTVCPGSTAYMWAEGGLSYTWSPPVTFLTSAGDSVSVIAPDTTNYIVSGTDQYGCKDTASVFIALFPKPFIQTSPNVFGVFGESYPITAVTTTPSTIMVWSPSEFLSCNVCENPIAQPDQEFIYTVQYIDNNGCTAFDSIRFTYDPIIYVPNTFIPDGDGKNDLFFAVGSNMRVFYIEIYNRWGELVFETDDLLKGWNGTYEGNECPDGVYVWKIRYGEFPSDKIFELVGHVTLLR
jgi:gliding motility-associated-like protein